MSWQVLLITSNPDISIGCLMLVVLGTKESFGVFGWHVDCDLPFILVFDDVVLAE